MRSKESAIYRHREFVEQLHDNETGTVEQLHDIGMSTVEQLHDNAQGCKQLQTSFAIDRKNTKEKILIARIIQNH